VAKYGKQPVNPLAHLPDFRLAWVLGHRPFHGRNLVLAAK